MRAFSSRRASITADLRARAARFEQRYGRAPSQRELAQLAQASNFKTRNPKHGALDLAQAHAGWADKLARTLGVSLATVAPSVWHAATGRATAPAPGAEAERLPELELARATQKAVALAQQEKSTWTRADVIKYLGRVLPRTGLDPAAATALLEDLADRALRSEFEPVTCLEAPEPAEVPRGLLRADGRSVYQRHGGIRYATRAQLVMEERMLAQVRADTAPRLTRAQAAHVLGADPAQLDAALAGRADAAQDTRTRTGLRTDQAAAAHAVLTDGQHVSVINAPAGSGKTRVLTDTGRAWTEAGLGPVVGITASQSARNTLATGVPVSYNAAQFLGHLPGRRGARGPVETGPAPLLVIDEASAMPGPDLADLIAYARARDGKVVLAGDTGQLQAVENGGGMSLLADALGYVRLAEPVRFRSDWEQQASLRLHDGDTTVLAEYDQHGRIIGGDTEQMMDAAAAAYVALTCDGTDVLLMAADHALRRELCRRIRDDLIALGVVAAGPAVRIAGGAQASAGDLITCTRNDHQVEAGEPGRTLANGDLLRVEAVTAGGLVVRRALDADPQTGQRRWTDRTFLYPHFGDSELGYAVTDHVAMGRTVHTGLAVITGTEDRQHAYVALTRGTDANYAYVFTLSPKLADPVPGPRPAPELARYDKISAERAGVPAPETGPAQPGTALGVLATVLDHDGQQLSATQTRSQAIADADHLALLHAIWTAESTPARQQRYRDLLLAALPPEYRREPGHQARWLWRTLRGAELAGLDAAQVLADAIAERDLAGARDVPSVVDARIRYRLGSLVPHPVGPWSAQVPGIADPDRRAYAAQIAALMDARKHPRALTCQIGFIRPVCDDVVSGHADAAVRPGAGRPGYPRSRKPIGRSRSLFGLRGLGTVGPCGGFVVLTSGFQASVQDADQAAGDAAQRVVVAGLAGAEVVVVAAGTRGHAERGQRLGVQGVDEVPVADIPGVHGLLLAGLDGQRGGSGVVLAGLRRRVAAGGVAELAEDPRSGDVPDAGLGQVEPGIRVTSKKPAHLGFHDLDLLVEGGDHGGCGLHRRGVRLGDHVRLDQVRGAQRGLDVPRPLRQVAAPPGPLERGRDLRNGQPCGRFRVRRLRQQFEGVLAGQGQVRRMPPARPGSTPAAPTASAAGASCAPTRASGARGRRS